MIVLAPIGFSGIKDLQQLRLLLEKRFNDVVHVVNLDVEPAKFFDASRNQYYSSEILKFIDEHMPENAKKVLAVTRYDLFIPILTYVFGESQLDGKSAIVSSFRLDNKLYGLPDDPDLLRERLAKEAVHELGHAFGLIHCRELMCVMRSSTYAEELDLKTDEFCENCAAILKDKL